MRIAVVVLITATLCGAAFFNVAPGLAANPAWAQAVPQPVSPLPGSETAEPPGFVAATPDASAAANETPPAGFTPMSASEAAGTPALTPSDADDVSGSATATDAAEATDETGTTDPTTAAEIPTAPVETISESRREAPGFGIDGVLDAGSNLLGFFLVGFAGAFALGVIVAVLAALRHTD